MTVRELTGFLLKIFSKENVALFMASLGARMLFDLNSKQCSGLFLLLSALYCMYLSIRYKLD